MVNYNLVHSNGLNSEGDTHASMKNVSNESLCNCAVDANLWRLFEEGITEWKAYGELKKTTRDYCDVS